MISAGNTDCGSSLHSICGRFVF